MKTNKLLAAGALALSMAMTPVASMLTAMPVMAATINFPTETAYQNHTYEVYQIFTGTLSSDGKLSDIKWGENGTGQKGQAVPDATIKTLTGLENKTDVEELVEINKIANLSSTPVATLTSSNSSADLPDGYYIIKDKDNSLSGTTDDAYTLYITKVAGTITISPKTGIPTVDKEVWDDADPDSKPEGWGETADHDLNETFQFKLTGTVSADTLAKYSTYKMVFHDTVSKGVTVDTSSVKVYVNDSTHTTAVTGGYTVSAVTTNDDGTQSFTVTFDNVKNLSFTGDLTIDIIYDAKLNENAVLNETTDTEIKNKNTVYLEYSNNPNAEGTGNTKEDHVYVASFKLTNNKVDGSKEALAGAEFKLYNSDKKVARFDANNKFVAWDTNELTGGDLPSGHHYAVASGANGDFSMYGLDAGVYTLIETKTPDGYNTAADTTITVKATHTEAEGGDSATVTLDANSSLNTTVVNTQNGTLPETGGMGTTIIYSAGALLAAGAAVVYVTNKRTRKN